jgi:hypothetical protein
LHRGQGILAGDLDLAHVADVEDTGARAHGEMLVGDAGILDGHVPAGVGDHAGVHTAMTRIQRGLAEFNSGRVGQHCDCTSFPGSLHIEAAGSGHETARKAMAPGCSRLKTSASCAAVIGLRYDRERSHGVAESQHL